jgi:hypothetical protein
MSLPRRIERDAAAVPLDDSLADRQPYTGAGNLLPSVEPLEHSEDPFQVLRLNAWPIVFDGEYPFCLSNGVGRNVHKGDGVVVVLDGIADEVLEDLSQLGLVCLDGGQRVVRHLRAAFLDGAAQIEERAAQCLLARGIREVAQFDTDARIGEEILD